MKIKRLCIKNHSFLGTTEVDFTAPSGEPLNTVVLAGINGSGKTTLLYSIKKLLEQGKIRHTEFSTLPNILDVVEYIQLVFTPMEARIMALMRKQHSDSPDATIEYGFEGYNPFADYAKPEREPQTVLLKHHQDEEFTLEQLYPTWIPSDRQFVDQKHDIVKLLPKCITLPSETHFNNIQVTLQPFTYQYRFFQTVDRDIAQHIPDYFATFIDKRVYQNEDIPVKESIQHACADINTMFETLDLESRLIGIKSDGSRMPVFRNHKSGKEFDIQGLSSGEKQLFFRIMAVKMFEAHNSILLVDEPEISLHPAWQQKILKIYEQVGQDNQVIVATHSPHIIASTPKKNVKILTRNTETNTFEVIDYTNIQATKGVPVERILKDVMGLPTTRDPEVQERINQLWEWIYQGDVEIPDFTQQYHELEQLLGTIDEDLVLMKMEMAKQKWKKEQ